ncbi:Predicted ATPase, AAA+ superfamily [Cohaesibacter sp. ES.047]|uniref:AAA family ATPase n=1 Tax=Cohaesibacter sp. ES.047 TaxID=1798205 RepID=UPI000BB69BFB|nr:ATP-binding protein [Cohaesibacter sp. ES.047]SNY93509.1 Predicted ATPase, AAA+ superfamily [Cohaesibacter sp. ES.047]
MSNTKHILAMLRSRASGDDEQFYSIALQIAAAEARQGRRSTADDLRSAVDEARALKSRNASVAIPFSQPRGDLEALVDLREPKLRMQDVVLHECINDKLKDLIRQQAKRDWLREHGKTPNRSVLFLGPPGSGKTMTAEALAGELHLPLFVIRLESLITRFMGETASKLRLVFDETLKHRGVYLFDEFDAIGSRRSATNDVAEMRRVLNSFLQLMEQPNATDSILLGATNHPELLDRALLRRFDAVIEFTPPSEEQIRALIEKYLKPLKRPRLAWKKIIQAAEGLSQSEIARASEDAVKTAILDERDSIKSEDVLKRLNDRREMREVFLKVER